MQILVSTTGTLGTVSFGDLAGFELTHPTVDYNLLEQFTLDNIFRSSSLQSAITSGYVTVKDDVNYVISNVYSQLAPVAECKLGSSSGGSDYFVWQVHKTKNGNNLMSNATWFDCFGGTYLTGSYSGYSCGCTPLLIPYNFRLVKAFVTFRYAAFDWRGTAGNLYLELGFYTMFSTNATDYCRLTLELPGSFSGSNTGYSYYRFEVSSFVERVGTNSFVKDDFLGVMFRKDTNIPGQISSVRDPVVQLHFEGL